MLFLSKARYLQLADTVQWRKYWTRSPALQVQCLAQLVSSWVTLTEFSSLSVPQFSQLQNEGDWLRIIFKVPFQSQPHRDTYPGHTVKQRGTWLSREAPLNVRQSETREEMNCITNSTDEKNL